MEHLFKDWEGRKKEFSGKTLAFFFDFDGTLTPIVRNPGKAALPLGVRGLLRKISVNGRHRLAIVSGRALADIKKKISISGITYVGNYGLEIDGPKISFSSPVSPGYKKALKCIKNYISDRIAVINGALLEDKGLSLSLHYRLAQRSQIPKIKSILLEALTMYSATDKIKINLGKKVFEIRPAGEWGKGKVVLWLLARWRFNNKDKEVLPIYAGDDTSDEEAFKALRNEGITIFVGEAKKSCARYYLKDTREVKNFLKEISNLR
ncbi:MAG: trehalose-phosphatase [Candidatus Omnitrophica bacterium]|nr:trehalose-phosphatase [Candidatus Omnitrophota bacterium]MDD5552344.1 trehalose-phosphatase [Candidatus Omnitrophota bacterium]